MADNRIAYGMLKQAGINTDGMSPKEAWEKLEELKDAAVKKGYSVAHKVDFTANNIASLNAYVSVLNKFLQQYNMGKIKSISTADVIENNPDVLGARTADGIILKNSIVDDPQAHYNFYVKNFQANVTYNISQSQKELSQTASSEVATINKLQNEIILYRVMQQYNRYNVCYEDCIIESAVAHEFAHELFSRFDLRTKEFIKKRFDMFKNTSIFKKVSYYASINHEDFFAECFVLKTMMKEPLPQAIRDLLEGVGIK